MKTGNEWGPGWKTGNEGGEIGRGGALFPNVRAKGDILDADGVISRIAARQHGVISVAQLRSAGLSSSAIDRRVANARLHSLHRAVYAVGHPRVSERGRWMAAVLACGEGAVLSHTSAGELWGMLHHRRGSGGGGHAEETPVHVTVPGHGGRKRQRGISLHRSSTLTDADCIRRDNIPVTTAARTLADLRPVLSPAQFAAALREAEYLRLPIGEGVGSLRQHAPRTRSELETAFLAVVRRHRLPRPEVNAKVDRYEVDFLWRNERLIVEVDGWEGHRTRSAFEEDRARDVRLMLLGFAVLRFTWRQIESDSAAVALAVRAVLRRAA